VDLDAGCCTARDGSVAIDGSIAADGGLDASVDGGCKNCPIPECTMMSDCKGKTGGEYCSAAMTCVQCLESASCAVTDPVCTGNACVGCAKKADCVARSATPACDAPSGDCVECTASDAVKCAASSEVCKAGGTECVQCNVNADCKDGTKPICGTNNLCRGCTVESDCQGDGKVCREATGECVACEPNKDDPSLENCQASASCEPGKYPCTGRKRRSIGVCGKPIDPGDLEIARCKTDSECIAGHRCIAADFKGQPYGSYCLQQIGSGTCPARFSSRRSATSALGVQDFYCFPDTNFTTCEAVWSFGQGCSADTTCGAEGVDDALCRDSKCTWECNTQDDCSGSNNCLAFSPQYCNPN
jgi:hypothetical protein